MNKVTSARKTALVALLCAAVGGAAAVVWFGRDGGSDENYRSAARIERVGGDVGIARLLEETGLDAEYERAAANMPLTVGDRLYAGEGGHASVAFTGRNTARLEQGAALDVLGFSDGRTQLALRGGRAVFDLHDLSGDDYYEVATPYGAFELREPGFYEVGYDDDGGGVFLSVLNGAARFIGLAGSGDVGRGEVLSLLGQTAADIALTRLNPDYAGGLLDDYHAYQYPDTYDGRYLTYDTYLEDPFHYDPYRRYESYRYVSPLIPGVRDLDRYGVWQEIDGHGYAWTPQVTSGWAPYREGQWMLDDVHGMTWVSTEPWGYAPYHYGRWVNSGGQWYWVPEGTNTQPVYAPALVAFVPLEGRDEIGWVPLAPGDPYVPLAYGPDWQPVSTGGTTVVEQVVNLFVPGALTVSAAQDFGRGGASPRAADFDLRNLGRVRAVIDPLAVDDLRAATLNSNRRGNRIRVPREVLESYANSPVFVAEQPAPARAGRDQARALKVSAVPSEGRRHKLDFKEERKAAREETKAAREETKAAREETKAAREETKGARDESRAGASGVAAPDGDRNNREARRQQREPRRNERARRPDSPPAVAEPRGVGRAAGERPAGRAMPNAEGERVGGRGAARRAEERPQPAPAARPAEAPKGAGRPEARGPREERTPPGQARRGQSAPPQPQGRAQGAPARPEKPQGPPKEKGGGDKGGGKGKGRP